MSLFDFPRINIAGTVQLSPGTANNDDLAAGAFMPSGEPVALVDSASVMPITFGMSDADFIAWVQQAHNFAPTKGGTPAPPPQFPAEWNYYGDMSSTVGSGDASVVGVATAPGQILTAPDPSVPVSSLIGASLTYSGCITDVNTQNSPPATQFFIPQLTLTSGSTVVLQAPASKGVCQWINFLRNVNAQADQGAGGYIYHVVPRSGPNVIFNLPGFPNDPSIVGAIFRYYLYNPFQQQLTPEQQTQLYQSKQQNPLTVQFVATIAPLFANETITSGPIGRLLTASSQSIPTPAGDNNNSAFTPSPGFIALAPAVLQQDENTISVDFIGTFPDNFQQPPSGPPTNDKWDFGPVNLVVTGNGTSVTIGSVNYTDTANGNAAGWLFDFDISANTEAQKLLSDLTQATFSLESGNAQLGTVLAESDYYFVTNQLAIYAEQGGAGDSFLNQGTSEPATVSVYKRGVELTATNCPPISVWSYLTVPWQDPGPAAALLTGTFQPGQPLSVDTSQPGNFNFLFTVGTQPKPGPWNPTFITSLAMTNATTISLRILPNNVDFSAHYALNADGVPVAKDSLTFDVVYQAVLRTYYLLFPAMNAYIDLSNQQAVDGAASRILTAIDPSSWMSTGFMPRTRDMSASRRLLLQAYLNAVIGTPPG